MQLFYVFIFSFISSATVNAVLIHIDGKMIQSESKSSNFWNPFLKNKQKNLYALQRSAVSLPQHTHFLWLHAALVSHSLAVLLRSIPLPAIEATSIPALLLFTVITQSASNVIHRTDHISPPFFSSIYPSIPSSLPPPTHFLSPFSHFIQNPSPMLACYNPPFSSIHYFSPDLFTYLRVSLFRKHLFVFH